jgi:hypothetical protein
MKKSLLIFLVSAYSHFSYAQQDNVGAGRAIEFDGIDDYVDLGNIYDDIALPITVSAWIYITPQSDIITLPIFDSQDNSALYNGFTMISSTIPHVGFYYGDGQGGNNPAYRRARAGYFQTMGRWVYITATAKSANDMDLYMNGYKISADYQGSSSLPMNSNSPSEVAKIGALFSNGNMFHFKGIMDELRIWNRSLSELEIRETMCRKLKGNESGLIGYWTFDEISGSVLEDITANNFDGELKGNPTRVYSGAPIGDESVFVYTNTWEGKSLSQDDLSVANITGNPYGIHIYKVNNLPSQKGGLNLTGMQSAYQGVFIAGDDGNNTFDLDFTTISVCEFAEREDNSVATWTLNSDLSAFDERVEIIPVSAEGEMNIDLGSDVVLCDKASYVMQAHEDPSDKTFLWSTGHSGPSITVTSSGEYWVQVSQPCLVEKDTITVLFEHSPQAFSLGNDEVLCPFRPTVLKFSVEDSGLNLTWQDGSKENTFQANEFGIYWLKVENECGMVVDSIEYTKREVETLQPFNFISPGNGDQLNEYFVLDDLSSGSYFTVFNRWGKEVYASKNYQNDWDGRNLPSGIYFYTLTGECIQGRKGTLTLAR